MAEFNFPLIAWGLSGTDNKNSELGDCKTCVLVKETLSSITAGFLVY